MRKTIGRSVAAAVLAAAAVVPLAGTAQAASQAAPAAATWKHDSHKHCGCHHGRDHHRGDWGDWDDWGGGLLTGLLRILL
ncbi:hypothetical protein C3486_19820 [Streptomyces sp. Ru73]|uniref:hypothetical protein n=1 Tax=Streptomyces sp. Ru73 TaxID=2080748 RepID=UPI000CDD0A1C|nr:hypothetical protein [Streptomyces sp. Ru73]POX39116.1 hypothetical protein C3486_19820 [Streptomyces sp. Ru73]